MNSEFFVGEDLKIENGGIFQTLPLDVESSNDRNVMNEYLELHNIPNKLKDEYYEFLNIALEIPQDVINKVFNFMINNPHASEIDINTFVITAIATSVGITITKSPKLIKETIIWFKARDLTGAVKTDGYWPLFTSKINKPLFLKLAPFAARNITSNNSEITFARKQIFDKKSSSLDIVKFINKSELTGLNNFFESVRNEEVDIRFHLAEPKVIWYTAFREILREKDDPVLAARKKFKSLKSKTTKEIAEEGFAFRYISDYIAHYANLCAYEKYHDSKNITLFEYTGEPTLRATLGEQESTCIFLRKESPGILGKIRTISEELTKLARNELKNELQTKPIENIISLRKSAKDEIEKAIDVLSGILPAVNPSTFKTRLSIMPKAKPSDIEITQNQMVLELVNYSKSTKRTIDARFVEDCISQELP